MARQRQVSVLVRLALVVALVMIQALLSGVGSDATYARVESGQSQSDNRTLGTIGADIEPFLSPEDLVSDGLESPSGTTNTTPLAKFQTFILHGGYVAAGVGLRNQDLGIIQVWDIPDDAQVEAAYLYWAVIDSNEDPSFGQGTVNNQPVSGSLVGTDLDPCWADPLHSASIFAYRANVTHLVAGNGDFVLSGFASGTTGGQDPWEVPASNIGPLLEGASLVIVWSHPDSALSQVLLYDGAFETDGIRGNTGVLTVDGFTAPSSPFGGAWTTFIGADGQQADVVGSTFNGNHLNSVWWDGKDPQGVPPFSLGNLWDTTTIDVWQYVTPSSTEATITTTGGQDCIVWIGQVFSVVNPPLSPAVEPGPWGTSYNPPLINAGTTRDPVHTLTGSFTMTTTDIAVSGRGPSPLFSRTYNSNDSRVGPLGPGWTHSYNIRLVRPDDNTDDLLLVGPQGRTDRYVANGIGGFDVPLGVRITLAQDSNGGYTASHSDQSAWIFDPGGRLIAIIDRHGNRSFLGYNSIGQLVTIEDPAQRGSLHLNYDASGRLVRVSDWLFPARVVEYRYDAQGRLSSTIDREGQTTSYGYDGSSHYLTTVTDARGNVAVTNSYDGQGRVVAQRDARGLLTGEHTDISYSLNPNNSVSTTVTYPATSMDPSWHPIEIDTYNEQGWLQQRIIRPTADPNDEIVVEHGYDPVGNLVSVTDSYGNTTQFCYDVDYSGISIPGSSGNMTRRIEPAPTAGEDSPVTLYQFDSANNLVQAISANGVTGLGSVSCTTDLSAAVDPAYTIDYGYDASQTQLVSVTRRFTDPELGLQTSITRIEYSDPTNPGMPTTIVPPRGNTSGSADYTYATVFDYHTSGREAGLLAQVTDPLGNVVTYGHDAVGRRAWVIDPLGNVDGANPDQHKWSFSYDQEDRLRFSVAPSVGTGGTALISEVRYDEVGNAILLIDANGQITRYVYDERDSLEEVHHSPDSWTDPSSSPVSMIVTKYIYDHYGNLIRMIRAAGDPAYERVADYTYDGLGRVRSETQYPEWPSTAETLVTVSTYDANSNQTGLVDPSGLVTLYEYDALNRLVRIEHSEASTPDVDFAYDRDANRTMMIDGTGTTTYDYDESGRLLTVNAPASVFLGYRYDLDGNRTKIIYPSGDTVAYTFDKAGRLAMMADWDNRVTSYEYFADSNIKRTINWNGTVTEYTYDNARRLTGVYNLHGSEIISQHTYTLDAVGNRTQSAETLPGLGQNNPETGVAWSWGSGAYAHLGDGTLADRSEPGQVSNLLGVTAIAAGSGYSAAVKDDGTVWTWGVDISGQLGTPGTDVCDPGPWSYQCQLLPIQVPGLADIVDVDVASGQALALGADGTIWAWGRNDSGQAGDGTTVDRGTPAQVKGENGVGHLEGVTTVGAGGFHSLASTVDGAVWAWGSNYYGQLGDRTTTQRATPVRVKISNTTYLSGAVAVDGGADHSLALRSDGTVHAWGRNEFGQLGDGRTRDRTTSAQVSGLTGVTAIAAGYSHNLALKGDGTVWAWGQNTFGQLGDGTFNQRNTPVQVSGLTDVVAISSGDNFNLALKSDGTIWAWGRNDWGQLGDGSTVNRSTPVQTSILTGVTAVAAGVFHSLAINDGSGVTIPDLTTAYDYDGLYRLTTVNDGSTVTSYEYDPANNRLSRERDSIISTYSYDRTDRVTSTNEVAYTFDARGNLVMRGTDSFSYDQSNQLVSAIVNGTASTYAYDGDGNRTLVSVDSEATNYVYDVNRPLPVVLDDGTHRYVWGIGLAYAVGNVGDVQTYHPDGVGSVRAVTDSTGSVIQLLRYDEFGVPIGAYSASDQLFGYTGEQSDAHTGLVYLRARYYDPAIGRFMSRDPYPGALRSAKSLNRYAYVGNNPMTFTDPSGLCEDPGGAGVRYCVDRFIPSNRIFGVFRGDGRGPSAHGGSYRIRHWAPGGTDACGDPGDCAHVSNTTLSLPLYDRTAAPDVDYCGTWVKPRALREGGGRDIIFTCRAGNSLAPGPPIEHLVWLWEDPSGNAVVVKAEGTQYPSLELWQYTDSGEAQLISFDARYYTPGGLYLWGSYTE